MSVLEVYRMVLEQADFWREQAKKSPDDRYTTSERGLREAMAGELYAVAANLERTPEVNPTK